MAYRHLLLAVGIVGLGGCKTLDSLLPFGLGESNEEEKIIAEANAQVQNNQGPAIGFSLSPDLSKHKCGDGAGAKPAMFAALKRVAQVTLESSDLSGSKASQNCTENFAARFADEDSLLSFAKSLSPLATSSGLTKDLYKGLVSYAAGTGDIDMYQLLMTQKSGTGVADVLQPLRENSASFTTAYARLPWDKQLSVVKALYKPGMAAADMQLPVGAINDMASERMQGIAEQYNGLVTKYHAGVKSLPRQTVDVAANPTIKTAVKTELSRATQRAVAPVAEPVKEAVAQVKTVAKEIPLAEVVAVEPRAEPAVAKVETVAAARGFRKASRIDLQSGAVVGALREVDEATSRRRSSNTSNTSWNLSSDDINEDNPWLRLKKLYGSDHTDGRFRRVWINKSGAGHTVKFKNWLQLTCGLNFDAQGNPAAMVNCRSAKGWEVAQRSIPLSCATRGKERVCSGRYTASKDGVTNKTTAKLIHLIQ